MPRKRVLPPLGSNGWPVCKVCLKDRPEKYNPYCVPCRPRLPGTNYERNREKHRGWMRAHYLANKESYKKRSRQSRLLRKYGLTHEEYDRRAEAQGWLCAICGEAGPAIRGGIRLAVDHCHETGQIRDLLCFRCNSLLGHAQDNSAVLYEAIEYLARHAIKRAILPR